MRGKALMLGAVLLAMPACKRARPAVADWVASTPAASAAAVSGQAGWLVANPGFQSFMAQQPMVEQALDLFLQKARINPKDETGRITIHMLRGMESLPKERMLARGFLIQLAQFKDPKALVGALAASFPPEGTLRLEGRDCPLFVILDIESGETKAHLRAAVDPDHRIWIGDIEALTALSTEQEFGSRKQLLAAASWVNPKATFQGFLEPEGLLASLRQKLPETLNKDLPQGIEALVWGVTPGPTEKSPYLLELALAGKAEGIEQAVPWLQRVGAAAGSVQSGSLPPPDILKEKERAGLRMSLTADQLKSVMEKLGQPYLSFGPGHAPQNGQAPAPARPGRL
ncbi:MAG TPA: hypothetical protein VJ483_01725 [Holophagaceae bacterium]|nr:hypothetical protein [Holophagaceae bacterium]